MTHVTLFVSYLTYSVTLTMEATSSSKMFVEFQRIARPYYPEKSTIHKHRCENLTS
jgi:hypothetical protein